MPVTRELILLLEAFAKDGKGWEPLHDCLVDCGYPNIAGLHFEGHTDGRQPCSEEFANCDITAMVTNNTTREFVRNHGPWPANADALVSALEAWDAEYRVRNGF